MQRGHGPRHRREGERPLRPERLSSRMLVVIKGVLDYATPQDGAVNGSVSERLSVQLGAHEEPKAKNLSEGHRVSEAALWMEWHNCGRLTAMSSSYIMALSASALGDAVKQHLGAHARSIMYARAFVDEMKAQEDLSDIMDLDISFGQH
mmetsp:Transcript_49525/g.152828  ORF Transcript_49525/g.152828 Transcript_49525/m.152828 type:complete len:149 (-) Transcript_49525:148-594(-)